MPRIRRIGRLVPCDEEGFLVNPTHVRHLVAPWDRAVEDVVADCRSWFGSRLDGIYLRGSVPLGTAVESLSDLDGFVLTHGSVSEHDRQWNERWQREFPKRHPFLTGLDVALVPLRETRHDAIACVLKTQTLHVWGVDRRPQFRRYRPGPMAAQHAYRIGSEMGQALLAAGRISTGPELRRLSTWITRSMIRAGFELVMEREQAFTRDLYPAWEAFSRHYPRQRGAMRRALELAVLGRGDGAALRRLLHDLGPWLANEADRRFPLPEPPSDQTATAGKRKPAARNNLRSALLRPTGVLRLRFGTSKEGGPLIYLGQGQRELGLEVTSLRFLEQLAGQESFTLDQATQWEPCFSARAVSSFLAALVDRGFLEAEQK